MTVLGLKLARRVNAVSSLHGDVSRANVEEPLSGSARKTPFPSVTLPPTACMSLHGLRAADGRLYDRHLGHWLA